MCKAKREKHLFLNKFNRACYCTSCSSSIVRACVSKNRQMKLNETEGRKEEWKDRGEKEGKGMTSGQKKLHSE